MSSFYGNIKNNSRASFIFDKIYPSRSAMESALTKKDGAGVAKGDGIFVNRYVLVNYNYIHTEESDEFINRYDEGTFQETAGYKNNKATDIENYGTSFDKTVWMKIYIDNTEKYILVGELNAKAPVFELITDAPSEYDGAPHLDLKHSGELSFAYHAPKNWDFILNEYNPESNYSNNEENTYFYYEQDIETKTFSTTAQYPFYNAEGFNPVYQAISDPQTEGIFLQETKSIAEYPEDVYEIIQLTSSTYVPNQYYIKLQNGSYKKAQGIFDSNEEYYTLVQKYNNNEPATIHKNDTKRLDIYLPSIGNSVSALYDSLYGAPTIDKDENNNNLGYLIGFTTTSTYGSSSTAPNCQVGNNSNNIRYLTDSEIDGLYHDQVQPHTIPVYDLTKKRRPYTQNQIFGYANIEPYDNIKPKDPISMGWALDLMKKYISELRFLAQGGLIGYTSTTATTEYEQNDSGTFKINGEWYQLTLDQITALKPFLEDPYTIPVYSRLGLQSDWALNDHTAFGYIHNRPWVVNSTAITAIWEQISPMMETPSNNFSESEEQEDNNE